MGIELSEILLEDLDTILVHGKISGKKYELRGVHEMAIVNVNEHSQLPKGLPEKRIELDCNPTEKFAKAVPDGAIKVVGYRMTIGNFGNGYVVYMSGTAIVPIK